jgi:hypothetical protein
MGVKNSDAFYYHENEMQNRNKKREKANKTNHRQLQQTPRPTPVRQD